MKHLTPSFSCCSTGLGIDLSSSMLEELLVALAADKGSGQQEPISIQALAFDKVLTRLK